MKSISVAYGEGRYCVEATVVRCGRDLVVCLGGGDSPHVGATAMATPRPSLADKAKVSASASVLCVTGHKEDQLARDAALRLSSAFQCIVVVTVGLHVDDASAEEIRRLSDNYQAALDEVQRCVTTLLGMAASLGERE